MWTKIFLVYLERFENNRELRTLETSLFTNQRPHSVIEMLRICSSVPIFHFSTE